MKRQGIHCDARELMIGWRAAGIRRDLVVLTALTVGMVISATHGAEALSPRIAIHSKALHMPAVWSSADELGGGLPDSGTRHGVSVDERAAPVRMKSVLLSDAREHAVP